MEAEAEAEAQVAAALEREAGTSTGDDPQQDAEQQPTPVQHPATAQPQSIAQVDGAGSAYGRHGQGYRPNSPPRYASTYPEASQFGVPLYPMNGAG